MVLVSVWLLVFRNRFTISNRKRPHRLVACLPAEPKSNGSGPHSDKTTSQDLTLDPKVESRRHMTESKPIRVRADFNGLFGELLCLSHKDTSEDADGNLVPLRAGMALIAFDEDADEHGNRDDLLASGTVEPSPEWLTCNGSRWVLRIDRNGVKHESELRRGI